MFAGQIRDVVHQMERLREFQIRRKADVPDVRVCNRAGELNLRQAGHVLVPRDPTDAEFVVHVSDGRRERQLVGLEAAHAEADLVDQPRTENVGLGDGDAVGDVVIAGASVVADAEQG